MIILFRIDDRLIHAQVVVGWGGKLSPDRIILADDTVSAEDWERELFTSAAEPDFKATVLPLAKILRVLLSLAPRLKFVVIYVQGKNH